LDHQLKYQNSKNATGNMLKKKENMEEEENAVYLLKQKG